MKLLGALLGAAPLLLAGCSKPAGASAPPATPAAAAPDSVVAIVDGKPITWSEMEKAAASRLASVRQEEYEARRAALEDLAYERLLAQEAAARGLTKDAYLQQEIEAKVKTPTQAELDQLYEANRARIGNRSKADVMPDIARSVLQQRLAERESRLRAQLLSGSRVSFHLPPPRYAVSFPESAPSVGPKDAPVTLVEFSDYQCPYCLKAQGAVEDLMRAFPDKIRFVHRELPLSFHPRAFVAAKAARCAGDQGRFWDYHRSLLGDHGDLSDKDLKQRAVALGMDPAKLGECIASSRHEDEIAEAEAAAQALGVNSTPTFFINGRMLRGVRSVEEFRGLVEQELRTAPQAGG